MWEFSKLKEGLEFTALIVGIGSVFWAIYTFTFSRKQFHHEVMISCIERFQAIIPELDSPNLEKRLDAIRKYIDLCNEELFYFKGNFVPDEVAVEWLDGMIFYLPLYDKEGSILLPGKFPEIVECGMLKDYPRMQKTFRISRLPKMGDPNDRKRCIRGILKNLKNLSYPCT